MCDFLITTNRVQIGDKAIEDLNPIRRILGRTNFIITIVGLGKHDSYCKRRIYQDKENMLVTAELEIYYAKREATLKLSGNTLLLSLGVNCNYALETCRYTTETYLQLTSKNRNF